VGVLAAEAFREMRFATAAGAALRRARSMVRTMVAGVLRKDRWRCGVRRGGIRG
jgi:hypothetical protein